VKTFTSTEGVRALGQILQQSASQLVVLPANWSEGLTSYPRGEEPAIYREIATQVKRLAAKKAETPRESNLVQQLSTTVPNKRMPLLIDHIRQNAAQVLKVDHSSSIDLHQPLHAMGLDSLMAVELRNTLGFYVGKTLPATLLFEFPTINELAQYIAKEVLALGSETKSTPAEDTQQPEPSNNLQVAKLDDLSEDELANMLEAKLRNLNS
jgi:acyl carrier protein